MNQHTISKRIQGLQMLTGNEFPRMESSAPKLLARSDLDLPWPRGGEPLRFVDSAIQLFNFVKLRTLWN